MCCWRFKKFNKKKLKIEKKIVDADIPTSSLKSEIKTEEVKEFTATAGTCAANRNVESPQQHKKKSVLRSADRKPTDKSKYVETMGELHKRIKNKEVVTQEELTKMSADDRKKRFAAAQKTLGFTPNTSIMDRLVKKDREKMERTQNSEIISRVEAASSKMGDITFGLPQLKKKTTTLDEDTQFTRIGGKETAEGKNQQTALITPANIYFQPPGVEKDQETDEINSEDEDEPVDEINWMYHIKEIQATQDILRIADGDIDKVVDGIDENSRKRIVFDPYAPLIDLEFDNDKQRLFTCAALRYGTFITTAQMAPTDKEKDSAAKKKKVEPPVVSVVKAGEDLLQFLNDYPSDAKALSDCDLENTQPQTEDALNQTQDSGKKKTSQDLLSSKRVTSRKKSRKGSREKPVLSREQKTCLLDTSAKKNSKEIKNGSKEKQKKSRGSIETKKSKKTKSKEENQVKFDEAKRKSNEPKTAYRSIV